jgi:TrmH family RNA methyltransferase
MNDPRIRKYNKKFWYSYAMGTYPTIDLLKYRSDKVSKVLLNSRALDSDGVKEIKELCKKYNVRTEISDTHIEHLAVKENTYAIGIFEKYEEDLDSKSNHLVLDQPRNMGNIGTIIRTMVGFGYLDLAVIRPAADIFDPMIVRSAMGAMFQIRFKYFDTFEEYLSEYPDHNKYLMMLDGATNIEEVAFKSPFSLVLGNESSGLPTDYASKGQSIFIEHLDKIDSLNLSVAAGISMYLSSKK